MSRSDQSPAYILECSFKLADEEREGSPDVQSDDFPGAGAVFLLIQVDMDSLEVRCHSICGARPSQGRVFLSCHLLPTVVQVGQLMNESSAELLQEGGVPGSRGVRCVEDVEALLEHLVEHSDGLGLLQLTALHHLLGKSEVFSVLETEVRGESPHLVQESEASLSGSQHMVQRQVTAQGSSRAVADQHQGHQ